MWDCEVCGCQAIAGTVEFCPQCFTPRPMDVAAGSPVPDASTSEIAVAEDREAPQSPEEEGDWGSNA